MAHRAELERRTRFIRTYLNPDRLLPREFADQRRSLGDFTGSPEEVAEQLRAAAKAGIDEVMVNTWNLDDIEVLEEIAREVMPRL